jgi:hypothetical protein
MSEPQKTAPAAPASPANIGSTTKADLPQAGDEALAMAIRLSHETVTHFRPRLHHGGAGQSEKELASRLLFEAELVGRMARLMVEPDAEVWPQRLKRDEG